MRTWIPPITLQPHPPDQSSQQSGPPALRGNERCLRLCPFPSSNAFRGRASRKRHHRGPKQASRPAHYRPSGICPVVCLRLLNCPIPSHLQAELYFTFLADRASFHKTSPSETLVTKKPIVTITTCTFEEERKTPPRKRQARLFHRFHPSGPFASSVLDPRTFALPS
jgi:hypothetical protein